MVRFILNDKEVSTDLPSGTTVLDFVRYHQHLMGTKIGCREGDCGACTVLIGELSDRTPAGKNREQKNKEQKNEEVIYRSMTSCLLPLANIHGKHVVTIEGINPEEGLNPVQQAMADAGATQCGFCTPGFVMSLAGFCLNANEPTHQKAVAAVDGNICRCTGYKSIERAASVVVDHIKNKSKNLLPAYFSMIKERLSEIPKAGLNNKSKIQNSKFKIVSGGTDLYVQVHDELTHSENEYVFNSDKSIRKEGNRCIIGAGVTVTDLLESDLIREIFPSFAQWAKLVSSTPIRNMATIAGNFVNASPIGDFTIFFLALDAEIVFDNRRLPLRKLYKGYKDLDKAPDEIIREISFEIRAKSAFFNFEKVSKRTHLDIASVNTAISLWFDKKKIAKAGISAGGVSPIPLFLQKTSSFLEGKEISDDIIDETIEIAKSEISPISDARGSKEYKTLLLGQLIKAHFEEYR
jgi:xanthine dehydrogenase small subunit